MVAGPARPVTLAARRLLGRGSADRLRVAERRREHEREERDERELHRGATRHDQVWEGGGEEGGRKRVRWSRQGRVKRFCAVPLREHVKFSRATSVFSVVGIENARSNRPSTTASRPAPSCGLSRAPRRLPVLSFPRRVSPKTRRGFPDSRCHVGSKIKSRLFSLLVQGVVSERTTPAVDLSASEERRRE